MEVAQGEVMVQTVVQETVTGKQAVIGIDDGSAYRIVNVRKTHFHRIVESKRLWFPEVVTGKEIR